MPSTRTANRYQGNDRHDGQLGNRLQRYPAGEGPIGPAPNPQDAPGNRLEKCPPLHPSY